MYVGSIGWSAVIARVPHYHHSPYHQTAAAAEPGAYRTPPALPQPLAQAALVK